MKIANFSRYIKIALSEIHDTQVTNNCFQEPVENPCGNCASLPFNYSGQLLTTFQHSLTMFLIFRLLKFSILNASISINYGNSYCMLFVTINHPYVLASI